MSPVGFFNFRRSAGIEYSRGYIQSWTEAQSIGEKSAQRIFAAADKILKAGTEGQ
jgi:hypothetical protein